MMHAIATALSAFFNMITTFCHAGEKVAKTADELAGWSHESAASFHDEAKHNRALSLEEAAFKRQQKKKELDALRLAAEGEATVAITQASAKGAKNSAAASVPA